LWLPWSGRLSPRPATVVGLWAERSGPWAFCFFIRIKVPFSGLVLEPLSPEKIKYLTKPPAAATRVGHTIYLTGWHPEAGKANRLVSDSEPGNFLQGQGNQNLNGGVVLYAKPSSVQIDAEIAEQGGFRIETDGE